MHIPEEWIKRYVGTLLEAAGKLQPGAFRDAVILRADHAMDLVKAWREDPNPSQRRGEQ